MKTSDTSQAQLLTSFEAVISDQAVVRIEQKIFNAHEYINVHLWSRDKKGKLFPRKGRGLCLGHEAWEKILKVFSDNKLPYPRTRTSESNDTITNG